MAQAVLGLSINPLHPRHHHALRCLSHASAHCVVCTQGRDTVSALSRPDSAQHMHGSNLSTAAHGSWEQKGSQILGQATARAVYLGQEVGHDEVEEAVGAEAACHALIEARLLQQRLQHHRQRLHGRPDRQRLQSSCI